MKPLRFISLVSLGGLFLSSLIVDGDDSPEHHQDNRKAPKSPEHDDEDHEDPGVPLEEKEDPLPEFRPCGKTLDGVVPWAHLTDDDSGESMLWVSPSDLALSHASRPSWCDPGSAYGFSPSWVAKMIEVNKWVQRTGQDWSSPATISSMRAAKLRFDLWWEIVDTPTPTRCHLTGDHLEIVKEMEARVDVSDPESLWKSIYEVVDEEFHFSHVGLYAYVGEDPYEMYALLKCSYLALWDRSFSKTQLIQRAYEGSTTGTTILNVTKSWCDNVGTPVNYDALGVSLCSAVKTQYNLLVGPYGILSRPVRGVIAASLLIFALVSSMGLNIGNMIMTSQSTKYAHAASRELMEFERMKWKKATEVLPAIFLHHEFMYISRVGKDLKESDMFYWIGKTPEYSLNQENDRELEKDFEFKQRMLDGLIKLQFKCLEGVRTSGPLFLVLEGLHGAEEFGNQVIQAMTQATEEYRIEKGISDSRISHSYFREFRLSRRWDYWSLTGAIGILENGVSEISYDSKGKPRRNYGYGLNLRLPERFIDLPSLPDWYDSGV